ncbi:MAG TPA: hypothetical protein VGD94_23530 [Vicinamibacterales bacterium]
MSRRTDDAIVAAIPRVRAIVEEASAVLATLEGAIERPAAWSRRDGGTGRSLLRAAIGQGLTADGVAHLSGLPVARVRQLFDGDTPTPDEAAVLAAVLPLWQRA